ncbi:MAG: hypothetical protein KatS3mg023_0741 [Armatimonadota bacterium]|nr:MAG: hypothetical protein KatS3mg023_0741 [Armatimonadota bacterium]
MTKVTPIKKMWREKFLAALARGCSVSQASRLAGISRQHAYRCRSRSQTFAQQWQDAWEQGTDALEDEAVRRALAGSDTLLMFLLKARRPEKFRDNVRVEHDASREMLDALESALKRVQSQLP